MCSSKFPISSKILEFAGSGAKIDSKMINSFTRNHFYSHFS